MNNIQKNFKMKSRLRGLADGGVLGSGGAGRAEKALMGRAAQLAAMEAAAMGQAPTPPPPPPPPPKPVEGLADGGVLGSGAAGRAEKTLMGRAAQLAAMEAAAMGQAPTPPPPPPPPPPQKLADGGQPNMLQRGAKAVGDYVGRIGPAWSESNAQFEATNPGFGQRMDRALMPHTGFGSALGGVHDAMGRGNLLDAAGEAVGTIPGFSALRGAKTGMEAAKAVGKQVGKQAGTEAYKQAGGMSVMPTTTPKPNPEARGQTVADYLKMSGKDWLELADKGLAAQIPTFTANAPQRWRDGYEVRQNENRKMKNESALRGLVDGGGMFTPEERARFAEQHTMQADADQAGFAQAAELAAAAPQAQPVALPQDVMPSGGAPVPDISELEPPEYELQDGGAVVGKGGPTDDLVGPVALSDEEYVLPADTVKIVGRDNLDKLRLATHDFKDPEAKIAATGGLPQPAKGSALRGLADGGTNWRVDRTGTARPSVGNSLVPTGSAPVPGTSVGPAISPAPASPGTASAPNWNVSSDGTARPSSGNSVGPARTPPNTFEGKFERVNPNQPRIGTPQAGPTAASARPDVMAGRGGATSINVNGTTNPVRPSPAASPSMLRRAATGTADLGMRAVKPVVKYGTRVAAPLAVLGGVAQSVDDAASGYQEQFNQNTFNPDTKYDGSFGDMATRVAADTGNVVANALSNIGDTATFGYAGKLGRGMSSLMSGGDFLDGWTSQSDREKFYAGEPTAAEEATDAPEVGTAPNLAPVEQDSYESKRLEQMGVMPEDQNAGVVPDAQRNSALRNTEGNIPGQMTNFGTLGGNGNIYGTATEEGGRINSFSGVGRGTRQAPQPGDPNFMGYGGGGPQTGGSMAGGMSGVTEWGKGVRDQGGSALRNPNQRDFAAEQRGNAINERYDRLERQLKNTYGPKGQGNLARRLIELEQNRDAALQGLDNNANTRYTADSSSAASRYAADSSLRGSQMTSAASMANAQARSAQTAQTAAMREAAKADKDAAARNKEGYARYTTAISNMFMGEDGKEDKQAQEDFTSFVQRTDPQGLTRLSGMGPDDMSAVLQELRSAYEMNRAQNESGQRGLFFNAPVTGKYDPVREVRDAALSDVFDGGLSATDYVWSNLPLTNPNVGVSETGRATRISDLATDSKGQYDSDKLAIIAGSTGMQLDADGKPIKKSSLRSN